jgi:Protein of unknown function (DUF2892)
MDPKKLVTLTFAPNVGPWDRLFRLLSGTALGLLGWTLGLSQAAATALSVLGLMWFMTGVLSRCSIYYVLGYSTCPMTGQSFGERS